jgi:hypothetical protein
VGRCNNGCGWRVLRTSDNINWALFTREALYVEDLVKVYKCTTKTAEDKMKPVRVLFVTCEILYSHIGDY